MESTLQEQGDNSPIDLIVWDLETTGFVAPECKILEIGAFVVRGDEVEQKHWVLKNEGHPIPEKITELTGITQEIIDAEGRDPKECLAEFLPLFDQCKRNVTHNGVRFDIPFLVNYAADLLAYQPHEKSALLKHLRSTAYDTSAYYKAKKLGIEPYFREPIADFCTRVLNVHAVGTRYTLNLCVEELGIVHDGTRHRAIADVALTHEVYKAMQPVV